MKITIVLASVLCVTTSAFISPATHGGEIAEALLECAAECDDAKRLACYDAQVAGLETPAEETRDVVAKGPEHDNNKVAAANPSETEATKIAAIDEFGRTGKLARENAPPVPDTITATIVRIETKPRGKRIIYLDNGQIWEESEKARNLRLDEGDRVMIESGFFGSYQLSHPDSNRFTRVTRSR